MADNRPTITRVVSSNNSPIEPIQLTRHAIGMVRSGRKIIYESDTAQTIVAGQIYFLARGSHYISNHGEARAPFEELCFYLSEEDIQGILTNFEINYNIDISNHHHCAKCATSNFLTVEPWTTITNFYDSVWRNVSDQNYIPDKAGERIKMAELLYLIISHEDSCLKSKIIMSIDRIRAQFEQVVHTNIFNPISVDDLADLTNRSLTSFKKEFQRIYAMPPHKWLLRQRLTRSRLLLIYSSDSIAEIGARCAFPNTSHFIKLFKRLYGDTPASFRAHHIQHV